MRSRAWNSSKKARRAPQNQLHSFCHSSSDREIGMQPTKRCQLHAKRTAAAASALHVRVIKLEAGAFDGLDVVNLDAIQVH
jgi:hypothetical protein